MQALSTAVPELPTEPAVKKKRKRKKTEEGSKKNKKQKSKTEGEQEACKQQEEEAAELDKENKPPVGNVTEHAGSPGADLDHEGD